MNYQAYDEPARWRAEMAAALGRDDLGTAALCALAHEESGDVPMCDRRMLADALFGRPFNAGRVRAVARAIFDFDASHDPAECAS